MVERQKQILLTLSIHKQLGIKKKGLLDEADPKLYIRNANSSRYTAVKTVVLKCPIVVPHFQRFLLK